MTGPDLDSLTREELLELRRRQIHEAALEAVRREVAWLREHNFPVWVYEDGRVVDAAARAPRPPADR